MTSPSGTNGYGLWKTLSIIAPILSMVSVTITVGFAKEILDIWKEVGYIKQEIAMKADKRDVPPESVLLWLRRHDEQIDRLSERHSP